MKFRAQRQRRKWSYILQGKKIYLIITIQEEDVRWWITNVSSLPVKQTNTISGFICKRTGKNREHPCARVRIHGAA